MSVKKEKKTIERTVTTRICDICGKSMRDESMFDCDSQFYWHNECTWEEYDFCILCMQDKVIPLIREIFGIEPRNEY
jgi:hypothetical protein